MTEHNKLPMRRLYIVLAGILILRFAFFAIAVRNPSGGVLIDSDRYLELANWIARHGNYVIPSKHDLIWPLGYPLFLRLLGSIDPNAVLPVYMVQLLLSTITACLLIALGKTIHKERAGVYAAILYGLSPNSQFWSLTVMSEILFAFWLTLSLYLFIRYQADRKLSLIFISGLALGIGALTRPIGLYLAPLWAIVLIWWESRSTKTIRWGSVISFLLGMILVILPWMMRNYVVRSEFVFSDVSAKTSSNFNLAYVIAAAEDISRDEATLLIESRSNLFVEALRLFRLYPREFIREQSAGILRATFGVESGVWSRILIKEDQRGQSFGILNLMLKKQFREASTRIQSLLSDPMSRSLLLLGIWGIGYTVMLYLLGMVGLTSAKSMFVPLAIVSTITVVYLLVIPGAAGQARFRIPSEPFIALMAGMGLYTLESRLPELRGRFRTKAAS